MLVAVRGRRNRCSHRSVGDSERFPKEGWERVIGIRCGGVAATGRRERLSGEVFQSAADAGGARRRSGRRVNFGSNLILLQATYVWRVGSLLRA